MSSSYPLQESLLGGQEGTSVILVWYTCDTSVLLTLFLLCCGKVGAGAGDLHLDFKVGQNLLEESEHQELLRASRNLEDSNKNVKNLQN